MTPRSMRRAQERKARKRVRKQEMLEARSLCLAPLPEKAPKLEQAVQSEHAPELEMNPLLEPVAGAAPAPVRPTEAQLEANRRNAQYSTGPRTEAGRARSSQNNFRHGFRSAFRLLPDENPEDYSGLLNDLRQQHLPENTTEDFLVERMAQHMWLVLRAQRFQDWESDDPKQVVYVRYETTNERAFHTCLNQLLKLRAEARKTAEAEFESQRKQEWHAARVRMANSKSEWNELNTEVKGCMQAPFPGHKQIPFEDVKVLFTNAVRDAMR